MGKISGPADDTEANGPGEVTDLLAAAREGDRTALERLFGAVYQELRRIAHNRRREWRGDDTLNTTALVHEAYLKLTRQQEVPWRDRGQFYATASKAMRHVLINYARDRSAGKRGGRIPNLPLDEILAPTEDAVVGLLDLDQALERLNEMSPRQADVVECRFFGGLGIRETAEALNVSPATVKRDWVVAAAWLRGQLTDDNRGRGHDA